MKQFIFACVIALLVDMAMGKLTWMDYTGNSNRAKVTEALSRASPPGYWPFEIFQLAVDGDYGAFLSIRKQSEQEQGNSEGLNESAALVKQQYFAIEFEVIRTKYNPQCARRSFTFTKFCNDPEVVRQEIESDLTRKNRVDTVGRVVSWATICLVPVIGAITVVNVMNEMEQSKKNDGWIAL